MIVLSNQPDTLLTHMGRDSFVLPLDGKNQAGNTSAKNSRSVSFRFEEKQVAICEAAFLLMAATSGEQQLLIYFRY